mgnify:CR=1 FL=1
MEVFVTSKAEESFDSIVNFIRNKWGENTAKQFIQKTDDIFSLLRKYPFVGQLEKDNIRGFQLSPQTSILYTIRNEKIVILSFFDARQDPKKRYL